MLMVSPFYYFLKMIIQMIIQIIIQKDIRV